MYSRTCRRGSRTHSLTLDMQNQTETCVNCLLYWPIRATRRLSAVVTHTGRRCVLSACERKLQRTDVLWSASVNAERRSHLAHTSTTCSAGRSPTRVLVPERYRNASAPSLRYLFKSPSRMQRSATNPKWELSLLARGIRVDPVSFTYSSSRSSKVTLVPIETHMQLPTRPNASSKMRSSNFGKMGIFRYSQHRNQ